MRSTFRRSSIVVFALLSAGAACGTTTEPFNEPEVESVRLTADTAKVVVQVGGSASPRALSLKSGSSPVTAEFLGADGLPDKRVVESDYEWRVTPTTPANLVFTRTGAFAGTFDVRGLASTDSTTATISLYHQSGRHVDFGPYRVLLRVR